MIVRILIFMISVIDMIKREGYISNHRNQLNQINHSSDCYNQFNQINHSSDPYNQLNQINHSSDGIVKRPFAVRRGGRVTVS